jgi:hypothetical protein
MTPIFLKLHQAVRISLLHFLLLVKVNPHRSMQSLLFTARPNFGWNLYVSNSRYCKDFVPAVPVVRDIPRHFGINCEEAH